VGKSPSGLEDSRRYIWRVVALALLSLPACPLTRFRKCAEENGASQGQNPAKTGNKRRRKKSTGFVAHNAETRARRRGGGRGIRIQRRFAASICIAPLPPCKRQRDSIL
ncbi:hypothetical protein N5P37_001048, partial [Trichoderma harzianum]